MGLIFGVGISILPTSVIAEDLYAPLYTNVVAGGTLNLASDITAHSTGSNTNEAAIVFEGDGTLNGSGGVTVNNVSDEEVLGSYNIAAIAAFTNDASGEAVTFTITNNNIGAIRVVNDQSGYYGSTYKGTEASGVFATLQNDLNHTVSIAATAGRSSVTTGTADAHAGAYGIWGINGSLNSDITLSALAGSATNTHGNADAYAEVYGVGKNIASNLTGTITAFGTGGTAISSSNGTANAYGEVYGVGENIGGDMTGEISATATGGIAKQVNNSSGSEEGEGQKEMESNKADAYALASGVNGNIGHNFDGTITANATGGSATSLNQDANAYGEVYGIGGGVSNNMTGTITATATGGTATSSNGNAYAYGDVYGVGGDIGGNMDGTIILTSICGLASSSNGMVYSDGYVYGVDGDINGSLGGTIQATATGGIASSSNNTVDANGYVYGVNGDIDGNMNGIITTTANAGTATSSASANAYGEAYGVKGNINSNMTGTITATATGGTANQVNNNSEPEDGKSQKAMESDGINAYGEAYGVKGNIDGNMDGTIAATATGGTTSSSNKNAYAYGEADGVGGDIKGNITGSITATARGGSATSLNTADAHGDASGVRNVLGSVENDITVLAEGGDAHGLDAAKASADAFGVHSKVHNNMGGNITSTATGGTASSLTDNAVANGLACGVAGPIFSNMTGSITATATAGTATSSNGAVNATGYAAGVDEGHIGGDMTGTITAMGTGGSASTFSHSANASGTAHGVGGIGGNMDGTISTTATGGNASSLNSYAHSYAEAMGVGSQINGNMKGIITASATGGTAGTSNNFATAYGKAYGVSGNINSNMTGTITATATGGAATSSNRYTQAYGEANGVRQGVNGNMDGTITATATGGAATSSNEVAYAYGIAFGVHNSVGNNMDGNITLTARGGLAMSENSQADAYGYASGIKQIIGNMDGDITVNAIGGEASSLLGFANACGKAYGVNGNINSNMTGTITATATGGIAKQLNNSSASEADKAQKLAESKIDAHAFASGVIGSIGHNFDGTIIATATGGNATSSNISADADSFASGAGEGIAGDMTGTITTTATGGTANSSNGVASAVGRAYGAGGMLGVYGDLAGTITAIATGGTATSENAGADASASAYGIGENSNLFNGDFSGKIRVHATGGVAQGSGENIVRAKTIAYGINATDITITNFSGSIVATAIAGIEKRIGDDGIMETLSSVTARGISANNKLSLNAHDGLIQAQVFAPEGYVLPEEEKKSATSIWGGSGADSVTLSRMSLIGDINLNGDENNISIQDDTEIYGNIYATGGALKLDVDSGILSFTDTASIRDLNGYSVKVNSNAGLGVALYAANAETTNAALSIDGALNITQGATLSAKPAPGESGAGIIGETFIAITAENTLQEGATFVQAESSLFTIEITNINNSVYINPTALKQQDAPISSSILASVGTLNSIMNNLSKQLRSKRMFVQQNGKAPAPQGASGPAMHDEGSKGEWSIYLRQFNDLGGVDSDGKVAGYDWKTYGFLLGTEKQLGENMLIGISGGAAWSDLDGTANSGSGDSELFNGSIYGNYFKDNWYTEFGLSYGRSGNDTRRIDTAGGVYDGDYDSDLFGSWFEGGYAFEISPSFTLEPYGRMAYIHGEHDGYTERAVTGTAPMVVSSSSSDNLITELGLRASNDWTFENESIFRLGFFAGWRQEWLDDVISVNTSLLGINQKARTPEADSAALILGVDADWYITNAWSIGLRYEPTFSGNWHNHAINGMLKYRF